MGGLSLGSVLPAQSSGCSIHTAHCKCKMQQFIQELPVVPSDCCRFSVCLLKLNDKNGLDQLIKHPLPPSGCSSAGRCGRAPCSVGARLGRDRGAAALGHGAGGMDGCCAGAVLGEQCLVVGKLLPSLLPVGRS